MSKQKKHTYKDQKPVAWVLDPAAQIVASAKIEASVKACDASLYPSTE